MLTGFHYPRVECIEQHNPNVCGIFLDDISTREQFAFMVYCCRGPCESNFPQSIHCALGLLASVRSNKEPPLLN